MSVAVNVTCSAVASVTVNTAEPSLPVVALAGAIVALVPLFGVSVTVLPATGKPLASVRSTRIRPWSLPVACGSPTSAAPDLEALTAPVLTPASCW